MSLTYVGLLSLLGLIWGASFLFVKIGVSEIPPLTFVTLRVLIGATTLFVVTRLNGTRLPKEKSVWIRFLPVSLLGIAIPFSAISWGSQYIDSGLAAILNATMPLFTFLLVWLMGERDVGTRSLLGVVLGFAGIVVLTMPQWDKGLQATLLGELAIVLAALSYAASLIYVRHKLSDQPPIATSLGQVSVALLFMAPLALIERSSWTSFPSAKVIAALLTLGVLGTGLAYLIYYRLLSLAGPTATSLVTYIVPIFGAFWGRVVLGESLSWHAFAALGLIIVGLLLIRRQPSREID